MEDGKKVSFRRFSANQKIACAGNNQKGENGGGGGGGGGERHPVARATSSCLLRDSPSLRAFKNALKVGTLNFANSQCRPVPL